MKKVLIAENDKDSLTFYEGILLKSGYHVLIATDAKESLKKYKSELEQRVVSAKDRGSSDLVLPFDAVMLNHRVSDEDGLQVAKEILLVNPRQRIVFVSDSAEYTAQLQKEFYGRADIIQKPFEPEVLIELLESTELYNALEKMGLNVQKLRECNLHHFQLLDLLAACMTLLEAESGNGK